MFHWNLFLEFFIKTLKNYLSDTFCIFFKVVEYSLPSRFLHFNRVLTFGFKCFCYMRLVPFILKCHFYFSPIANCIFKGLIWFYMIVYASEVKAHAAVFCFHAKIELTSFF